MKYTARSWIAALACLAASKAGLAHAKLISATPAAGGAAAPTRALTLTYNEAISGKLSGATVTAAGGPSLPATVTLGKAGKSLEVLFDAPLKPGTYLVTWHAVASDDGHRTGGSYTFTVR